jgi:hypothetical protein
MKLKMIQFFFDDLQPFPSRHVTEGSNMSKCWCLRTDWQLWNFNLLVPAGTVLATYLSQGQLYQRWWHRASTQISRINHHCLRLFTAGRVDIGNLDRWRRSDLTPPTGSCNHCESSCAFYARLEDCANIACSLDACTRAITRFDLLWLSICEECPAHA